MGSEYDTDSKRVVGTEVSGGGYLRIPGFKNHPPKRLDPSLFKLVLDEDERLQTILREAIPSGDCHCLALGYTREQCKAKECHCESCALLASWFFCEELVIQEEPG